jgi:hypothetical protein
MKFIECLLSKPRSTSQTKGQLCFAPSSRGMAETFKVEASLAIHEFKHEL